METILQDPPRVEERGTTRDNREYSIKSAILRNLCRGLEGTRFYPRSERDENDLAGLFLRLLPQAMEYRHHANGRAD